MRVLVIDNYDSFVYNLVQYLGELGASPLIYRNDKITILKIKKIAPDGIVISPGPGRPENKKYFGICSEILTSVSKKIPTLGICLGYQGIAFVFGGKIKQASKLMHGKISTIVHDGKSIFKGIPNPIKVGRYHSLVVSREKLPKELEITASAIEDNEIMGLRHKKYPIEGLQFHPESVLTELGKKFIKNFLGMCKNVKRTYF
ncbi:MAG: aminodeoxychorismate/anthranilate synthase component II [Candidatus Thermoplasmatota archaeon]